jgi:hypothetical protein
VFGDKEQIAVIKAEQARITGLNEYARENKCKVPEEVYTNIEKYHKFALDNDIDVPKGFALPKFRVTINYTQYQPTEETSVFEVVAASKEDAEEMAKDMLYDQTGDDDLEIDNVDAEEKE